MTATTRTHVKQAFSLALCYLLLHQVILFSLPGSPVLQGEHFSPLPLSSCYVTFLCCCCEMSVYFTPFSSSYWPLRVLHNCFLFLCIYMCVCPKFFRHSYMSYVKEKNKIIKYINVWAFSHSYWRAAQCDSTASHPAAVWAGKHEEYEPKCFLMPKHA